MTATKRNSDNYAENGNTQASSKKQKTQESDTNNDINNSLETVYLSTIDRKRLDFDFEKVCSVTLSNINIYGCLVCGKYFQGRGKSSPAFLHSIDVDHHIFISFSTLKAYILPENRLLESSSLNDIKYTIYPKYRKDEIDKLTNMTSKGLNGESYKPGFIGLNNIKANDYMNVILIALSHTRLIKETLLLVDDNETNELISKSELNKRYTTFVKKLWSPRLFKNHISPHEVLQLIGVLSNKKFTLNTKKDPKEFLIWLLNSFHRSFSIDKSSKSIISASFQGKLRIQSQKLSSEALANQQMQFSSDQEVFESITKFWILTLDLPPMPFFKDGSDVDKIPQVKLSQLLEKYNGEKENVLSNHIKRYLIEKYPPYLILHFNRFRDPKLDITLGNKDRNQTIVEFPLEIGFKDDTVKYRLNSNIVHKTIQNSADLQDDDSSDWSIQLRRNSEWIEVENLDVRTKEKEFLFLSESYIQIWERVR